MKISALFGSLVMVLFITGCASGQHVYTSDGMCLTCWNNPLTGEPINHDGTENLSRADREALAQETAAANAPETNTSATTASNKMTNEYQVAFSVPVNVDVAFLKIKREFNYYTEQEIRQEWGSMAEMKMQTFAFAYDATPSVYYRMRAGREQNGVRVVIDSQIEKQSENQSQITITYWPDPDNTSVDPVQLGEALKTRTRNALNI